MHLVIKVVPTSFSFPVLNAGVIVDLRVFQYSPLADDSMRAVILPAVEFGFFFFKRKQFVCF